MLQDTEIKEKKLKKDEDKERKEEEKNNKNVRTEMKTQEEYVNSNTITERLNKKEEETEVRDDERSTDMKEHVAIMKDGEGQGKKDEGLAESDPTATVYKHVHFEMLPEDEREDISDSFQINVSMGEVVNKVLLMDDNNDTDEKHKIDNFYVQFPSSQSRAPEIISKLKAEDERKSNKYCPQTEDITDDEDEKKKTTLQLKQGNDTSEVQINDGKQNEDDEMIRKKEPEREEEEQKTDETEAERKSETLLTKKRNTWRKIKMKRIMCLKEKLRVKIRK